MTTFVRVNATVKTKLFYLKVLNKEEALRLVFRLYDVDSKVGVTLGNMGTSNTIIAIYVRLLGMLVCRNEI